MSGDDGCLHRTVGSPVTGGGHFPQAVDSIAQHVAVFASQPFTGFGSAGPDGYLVRARNNGTGSLPFFAVAMCAS